MHILFITTYFEPDSGAAAVRLSRLAHILHQRGHQITVLTTLPHYPAGRIAPPYQGKAAVVEDRDGLRVIRAWLWATPSPKISRKLISQNSFMLSALLRGFGIQRPDVMFIEAQPVFTSFAGVILSQLKRVPYVLNISDLWPDHLLSVGALTETHPVYRIARFLVDASYRGAGAIVSLSPGWAQKIQAYIGQADHPTDKVQVIYNGVDLARFRPGIDTSAFRQKYNLPDDKLVTFIGTFATQYDFDAMFAVAQRLPDVSFVFIGGGSQAQRVYGQHLPNVRLIDWISHEEIPQAWNASYIAYLAMRDEALYRGTIPAKLYELLACGVPIAAAIDGAGAEMIRASQGGVLAPAGDVDGLQAAVSGLLRDEALYRRLSQSARQYAEAHFDPYQVAEAYEAVFERVLPRQSN